LAALIPSLLCHPITRLVEGGLSLCHQPQERPAQSDRYGGMHPTPTPTRARAAAGSGAPRSTDAFSPKITYPPTVGLLPGHAFGPSKSTATTQRGAVRCDAPWPTVAVVLACLALLAAGVAGGSAQPRPAWTRPAPGPPAPPRPGSPRPGGRGDAGQPPAGRHSGLDGSAATATRSRTATSPTWAAGAARGRRAATGSRCRHRQPAAPAAGEQARQPGVRPGRGRDRAGGAYPVVCRGAGGGRQPGVLRQRPRGRGRARAAVFGVTHPRHRVLLGR
jgi:translation initiation factor IF-2